MGFGLKVMHLRANAFSRATYGFKSLTMTSGDKNVIDAFEMW